MSNAALNNTKSSTNTDNVKKEGLNQKSKNQNNVTVTQKVKQLTDALIDRSSILVTALRFLHKDLHNTWIKKRIDCLRFILKLSFSLEDNSINKALQSYDCKEYKKSSVYRFLSSFELHWHHLAREFSVQYARSFIEDSSDWDDTILVVDDTTVHREDSKFVEMLSYQYDHADHRFVRGFKVISVGIKFLKTGKYIPLEHHFVVSNSDKAKLQDISDEVKNNEELGRYVQRMKQPKLIILLYLLAKLKKAGIETTTIAMDSWFSSPSQIIELSKNGFSVVSMLKNNNTKFYDYETGKELSVNSELARISEDVQKGHKYGDIAYTKHVWIKKDDMSIRGNIVFSKNTQSNADDAYVALISSSLSFSSEEVVETYKHRWSIETYFRNSKEEYGLEKGNQTRKLSSNIALLALCNIRIVFNQMIKDLDKTGRSQAALIRDLANEARETQIVEDAMNVISEMTNFFAERFDVSENLRKEASSMTIKLLESTKKLGQLYQNIKQAGNILGVFIGNSAPTSKSHKISRVNS